MLKKRLIAVLILNDGKVVQTVRFKHTNIIHSDAVHAMEAFNKWAVDEIVVLNVSKDQESRYAFSEVVSRISGKCFVPLSIGGWISDEEYAQKLLRSGADKLVLNTALFEQPELVRKLSLRYGRQCIVVSIDAKRENEESVNAFVDRGKTSTHIPVAEWALKAEEYGAGEIFFNSIDHDGARKGYDLPTLKTICSILDIPAIAFGGVFTWEHLAQGIYQGADAVAAANIFHYTEQSTKKAKHYLADAGIAVRVEGRFTG